MMDAYTAAALKRGRPDAPCQCTECVCNLHVWAASWGPDPWCIWCQNGQHGGGRAQ